MKFGRYVVTGAVSGGRSKGGNCGGINNPTHYVRYISEISRKNENIQSFSDL